MIMKKELSLLLLLLLPLGAMAQVKETLPQTMPEAYSFYASDPDAVVRGMRYKELKSLYNEDDFDSLIDPRYRTGLAWLNLLLPGVGQYVMGEPGRGTFFLLTGLAGYFAYGIGAVSSSSGAYYDSQDLYTNGQVLFWSGLLITLGAEIASIIDGYHVAHVKSLYTEDLYHKRMTGMSLSMAPLVQAVPSPTGIRPVAGMGLTLQF